MTISSQGEVLRGKYLMIHRLSKDEGESRLGITVTRRFGKSHLRNQFKRRLREAFRTSVIPEGFDLNIRPRLLAKQANFHQLKEELQKLLSKNP